jgi:hypothetical protein
MSKVVFTKRKLDPEEKKFWAAYHGTLRAIDVEIAQCKQRYAKTPGPHLNHIEWRIVQGVAAQYVWNYLIARAPERGIDFVRPLIPATVVDLALVAAGPKLEKIKGCRLPEQDQKSADAYEQKLLRKHKRTKAR